MQRNEIKYPQWNSNYVLQLITLMSNSQNLNGSYSLERYITEDLRLSNKKFHNILYYIQKKFNFHTFAFYIVSNTNIKRGPRCSTKCLPENMKHFYHLQFPNFITNLLNRVSQQHHKIFPSILQKILNQFVPSFYHLVSQYLPVWKWIETALAFEFGRRGGQQARQKRVISSPQSTFSSRWN